MFRPARPPSCGREWRRSPRFRPIRHRPARQSLPRRRRHPQRRKARRPRRTTPASRSRRTSIRLEPEFWTALGEIAREQRSTISGVLLDIERIHGRSRFASKVRVAILSYYRR